MRNPFGKPGTLWQWWLGSLRWTVTVMLSWLLVNTTLLATLDKTATRSQQESRAFYGVLGNLGIAQVLITWAAWRRPGTYPAIGRLTGPRCSLLWRAGLAFLQVIWFLGTAIALGYALASPAHPSPTL